MNLFSLAEYSVGLGLLCRSPAERNEAWGMASPVLRSSCATATEDREE